MNLNLLRKRNFSSQPDEPDDEEEEDDDNTEELDETLDDSLDEFNADEDPSPPSPQTSRFQQLFGQAQSAPQGPLSTKLTDFLNSPVPKPEDYKPGKINRLAAILGGASEGYQKGASAGIKTASSIIDKPYQQGIASYKLRGQNLEKGAELESKNLGRAASFAKTAMIDEHNRETERLHQVDTEARAKHWDDLSKNANEKAKRAGFTKTVGADGHLYYTRPGADGKVETLDGGKMGESIPDKTQRELDTYSKKEKIRGSNNKELEGVRQRNRLELETDRAANSQIKDNKKGAIDQQLIKDREVGKNLPKTVESTVTDAEGKVTGKRVTKTNVGAEKESPDDKVRVVDIATGKPGTVSRKYLDPKKYKLVN